MSELLSKITSFFAAPTSAKTTTQQLNNTNTNTEQQQQFRLESCSPQGLVDALVAARGKDEASRILEDASTILAGGTVVGNTTVGSTTVNDNDNANANLGDATMVSPNEKRSSLSGGSGIVDGSNNNNKDKDSSNDNEKLLGRALLSEPIETSFLSPRMGKFSLQLHEHGLVATKLNDPTVKFIISKDNGDASSSSSAVSHVTLYPSPEACKSIIFKKRESKAKKVGGNLVVLRLGSLVHLPKQKSLTRQLCFALPGNKKLGTPIGPSLTTEGESSSSSSCDPTQAWGQLLHRALGGRLKRVLGFESDQPVLGFKSDQPPSTSTTTAGMPFDSCYLGVKVNNGEMYLEVVRDDFAQELVNEKRKKREEESATESEDEDSSSGGRRRISKRLRQTGA